MKSPESQTQAATALADLIRAIAAEIILHPEELQVQADVVAPGMIDVRIDARPTDVKRLIGTKGAHIRALRVFCKYFGEALDLGITIRDFESPKDNGERYPEFVPSDDWPRDKDRLLEILRRMASGVFCCAFKIEDVPADGRIFVAIRISQHEAERVRYGMAEAFKVLGLAMGKKHGHSLSVHLLQTQVRGPSKEIAEPAFKR